MFLSHFEHSGLSYWLDQDIEDCIFWYNKAVKVHNRLNDPEAEKKEKKNNA